MYKFIGIEYWGAKSFTEFKKYFEKRIRPDKMKEAYEYVKEEYKKAGFKEVKEDKK